MYSKRQYSSFKLSGFVFMLVLGLWISHSFYDKITYTARHTDSDTVKKPSSSDIQQHLTTSGLQKHLVRTAPNSLSQVTCHWPPPIYKDSKWTPMSDSALTAALAYMDRIYRAFANSTDIFVFIEYGIALGLYRDGFIVSDGDFDINFGTLNNAPLQMPTIKKRTDLDISLDEWGATFVGPPYIKSGDVHPPIKSGKPHKPTQHDLDLLRSQVCRLQHNKPGITYLPVLDDPWQRKALENYHGALWFVRMPWKSDFFMLIAWAEKWKPCIAIIQRMDSNSDGRVNETELATYVEQDGGDMKQYELQLTARDQCRAVAKANWILTNGLRYKQFEKPKSFYNIPFWAFPQCDVSK